MNSVNRNDFITDDILRDILVVCLDRDYRYMCIDIGTCMDMDTKEKLYQLKYYLFADMPAHAENFYSSSPTNDEISWDISDEGYKRWDAEQNTKTRYSTTPSYYEQVAMTYLPYTESNKRALGKITRSLMWTMKELFPDA